VNPLKHFRGATNDEFLGERDAQPQPKRPPQTVESEGQWATKAPAPTVQMVSNTNCLKLLEGAAPFVVLLVMVIPFLLLRRMVIFLSLKRRISAKAGTHMTIPNS
jgi:hypothetical protein